MKTLACIALCCSVCACGMHGYVWGDCRGDFMVSNACVATNGFPVDKDRLQGIIENTYNESVAYGGHQDRMDKFIYNTIVYLSFVEEGNKELEKYDAVGITETEYDPLVTGPNGDHMTYISVLVEYREPRFDDCLERSATAHEFVHVSRYAIKRLDGKGDGPRHPAGWFGEDSVEARVWWDYMVKMCYPEEGT